MVLYGIKVKSRLLLIMKCFFDPIGKGESNADYNADKYTCTFSKMIEYWRQVWNNRTNGINDAQFPFGFVQVSLTQHSQDFRPYVDRW
jgi:hypothetical protein